MKIGIYQPRASYYIGGAEVVALAHAKFLALNKHNVTLITTRAPFIKESSYFKSFYKENKNVKIAYIDVPKHLSWIYKQKPGIDWKRWDLESLFLSGITTSYFQSNQFNIVAVHNFLDALATPMNENIVTHLHGYPQKFNYLHEIGKFFGKNYVSTSNHIKKQWEKNLKIKNIFVATNGVESKLFISKPRIKKRYDVLYMGRLLPVKGVNFLIKAVSALNIPDLKIAIGGDGPEKNNLLFLAKKLAVSNKIKFLGRVPDKKLVDLYNSAKIAVLPSYDREGILTTMLEAASCGMPVITTSACSMKEFIKNKDNGILVKPKNARDIARAIKFFYENENLRFKFGEKARKDIIKKWDWASKIKDIEKIYEKISNSNQIFQRRNSCLFSK